MRTIPDDFKTRVPSCARCGGEHDGMLFSRFRAPIRIADTYTFTHWAMCPVENAPIILNVTNDLTFEDELPPEDE